jgi:hypothetical protein
LAQHVQRRHAEMAGADEGNPHGGSSVVSEVSLPSITRRRHLSRRRHGGQQVINRTRVRPSVNPGSDISVQGEPQRVESSVTGDLPFAYRVGAIARCEATQLRHFSSRQASANRFAETLAELFQSGPVAETNPS